MIGRLTKPPAEQLIMLRDALAARDGKPGFKRNCQALRAEIARLEREVGRGQA